MSGKRMLVVLIAIAVALFAAPTAQAAISGTSHEVTSGQYSACSMCHIPHGGSGARLWPVPPASAANLVGTISTLCGTCHIAGGTYAGTFVGAVSTTMVYGTESHGVQMTLGQIPGTSVLASSGLPYTGDTGQAAPQSNGGTVMECTSCHNVHDDTNKPFLRASLETLCQRCHGNRSYIGGSANQGSTASFASWDNAIRQGANPGSHPVGSNIDNVLASYAPISWPAQATVKKQQGTTRNQWHLGGHLAGATGQAGGMSCATCHAAHGVEADSDDGTFTITAAAPTTNMLIIAQGTGANEGVTGGYSVANGDGSAANLLCEGCHRGNQGSYTTTWWNPGGTQYGHPVDAKPSAYAGGFGAGNFPANWPKASTTVNGMDPICESCHSPHPAANSYGTLLAGKGPYILRDGPALICASCHTSSIANHHPVRATGGVAGVSYMTSGTNLTCGTCHAGNAAHNWPSAGGISLNANWRPADNARNVTAANKFIGDGSVGNYYASTTCMDCHIGLKTSPDANPGTWAATGEYQIHGQGTHYIGPFASSFFSNKTMLNSGNYLINVGATSGTTDKWPLPGTATATTTVWSKFGGTSSNPILVCESCHNVAPSKNNGNQLLLYPFAEGADNTFIQASSDLCIGCHGVPSGTHPETGNTVGRSNAPLSTSSAFYNTPTAGTGPTAGTNRVSCDSCHQPHSANTGSGSLIIDFGATLVAPAAADNAVTLTGVLGGTRAVAHRRIKANNNLPDFSIFCGACHTSYR